MVEMKAELDKRDVGGEMHHVNKMMYKIEASNKDMTDLIFQQTVVTTETVHDPKWTLNHPKPLII